MEDPTMGVLPIQLSTAIEKVYTRCGMQVGKNCAREGESAEYGACRLTLNGLRVVFRIGKTTPTKVGQFVTVWKRMGEGFPIVPLDSEDDIDYLIVDCANEQNRGQFIFSRETLVLKRILRTPQHKGKLSFRIYPPWTTPTSETAKNTQNWQSPYFLPFHIDGTVDEELLRTLLGNTHRSTSHQM